jgi:hypothetical protein
MGGSKSNWEAAVTGAVLLTIAVVALIAAWCLVRATNLVLRVLVRHPRSHALWAALITSFVLTVLAALEMTTFFVVAAFAAGVTLVLTARAVELYHSELFEESFNWHSLANDVLHEWWTGVA